jgi:hypothetical protein
MSVMNVVTRGGGHLTLRDFIASCQKEAAAVETATSVADGAQLSQFSSVIVDCDSILISDAEMSSIVFIAGYVGFKLKSKLSCIDCRLELLTDRALECDFPRDESFNYLASIDRGGLTWPTKLMVEIVAQTIIVFKCLVSAKYCKQFNMLTNQRSIMTRLACQRCIQVAVLSGKCSSCGIVISDLAKPCITTVSNISLNSYRKRLGDGKSQAKASVNCRLCANKNIPTCVDFGFCIISHNL